jgi:hypothetical protein
MKEGTVKNHTVVAQMLDLIVCKRKVMLAIFEKGEA